MYQVCLTATLPLVITIPHLKAEVRAAISIQLELPMAHAFYPYLPNTGSLLVNSTLKYSQLLTICTARTLKICQRLHFFQ